MSGITCGGGATCLLVWNNAHSDGGSLQDSQLQSFVFVFETVSTESECSPDPFSIGQEPCSFTSCHTVGRDSGPEANLEGVVQVVIILPVMAPHWA